MTQKGTVSKTWVDEVLERTSLGSAEEVVGDTEKSYINEIMSAARSNFPLAVDFIGHVVQEAASNGNFHEVKLQERTKKRRKTSGEFRGLITGDGAALITHLYRQCGWQLHVSMSSLKVEKIQESAAA